MGRGGAVRQVSSSRLQSLAVETERPGRQHRPLPPVVQDEYRSPRGPEHPSLRSSRRPPSSVQFEAHDVFYEKRGPWPTPSSSIRSPLPFREGGSRRPAESQGPRARGQGQGQGPGAKNEIRSVPPLIPGSHSARNHWDRSARRSGTSVRGPARCAGGQASGQAQREGRWTGNGRRMARGGRRTSATMIASRSCARERIGPFFSRAAEGERDAELAELGEVIDEGRSWTDRGDVLADSFWRASACSMSGACNRLISVERARVTDGSSRRAGWVFGDLPRGPRRTPGRADG